MRRWIGIALAAAVLGGGPPAARAADNEQAFRKVERGHWAYRSVSKLAAAGFTTGYPAGTFSGKTAQTRYDFAVVVERLYRSIEPRALSAGAAGGLPEDLRALRRLIDEFQADVADLQHDPSEMRQQVDGWQERLARLSEPPTRLHGLLRNLIRNPQGDGGPQRRGPFESPLLGVRMAPSIAANVGRATVDLQVQRSTTLAVSDHIPFTSAGSLNDYQARLSVPVGPVSVNAFFERQGLAFDPYGLLSPYAGIHLGPAQGVGGGLSGPVLSDRVNFELQGASMRSMDDDLSRFLYFKSRLSYNITSGFSLNVGAEFTRLYAPGLSWDTIAYTMGFGQSFGRNARLDFLLRVIDPGRGPMELSGQRDPGYSSAITQVSVKF